MSEIIPTQDPKYGIKDNQIVNMKTGEPIPTDEPIFIFRAKDRRAVKFINEYGHDCDNQKHFDAVMKRVYEFQKFRYDNEELMNEPDTIK